MKKIFAVLLLALAACLSASATSTTISGTKTSYPIGFLLTSGTFTFNGASATITNGAFSGTFTEGTSTVTITSGNQTILTIPNVTISATTYNWDSYVVPALAQISGTGSPTIACAASAFYLDTASIPYGNPWTCQILQGNPSWVPQGPNGTYASGRYAGTGAPAFSCFSPCQYTQTDAVPISAATWMTLAAKGFPTTTWALQSSQIASGTPFTVTSGCGTTGAVLGGTMTGTFTAGQTSCIPIITPGLTAPHGFDCEAHDITTPADTIRQSATGTTTCTLTGTVVNADVIAVNITAY